MRRPASDYSIRIGDPTARVEAHAGDLLHDARVPVLHGLDVDRPIDVSDRLHRVTRVIGFGHLAPGTLLCGGCALDLGSRRQATPAAA
jgi:hypothetical protein